MNKLSRAWNLLKFKVRQRVNGFEVGDEPWFDEETLEWFRERLPRAKSYMEFGSGGSTIMASRLGIPTISVEGDSFFAQRMRKRLAGASQVTLINPPIGVTGLWGVPASGKATARRARKWRSYIDLPFRELATSGFGFPDLFLVDGRFRRACALRAALEARKNGTEADLLFDDYFRDERTYYGKVEDVLGHPEKVGRSAIFRLNDTIAVTSDHVEEAIRDYR